MATYTGVQFFRGHGVCVSDVEEEEEILFCQTNEYK